MDAVSKLEVENKSGALSLLLVFNYQDTYQIGLRFTSCRMQDCIDIRDLLYPINMKIKNISDMQWEKLQWHITSEDDDANILFEYYAESVSLESLAMASI